MVGGKVIEVAEVKGQPEILFVNVGDRPYGKLEECGVYVELNDTSRQIEIGDSLWWQAGVVYWTPQRNTGIDMAEAYRRGYREGVDMDIQIPKVGGSGVKHPSRQLPSD